MAKKSDVNMSDLATWPIALSLVFAVVIAAAIAYGAHMFLIADVTSRVASLDSSIRKQESKYLSNQKIIALLPAIRKEVSELELVRDDAKKYLPTEVAMPSLMDNVYLAGRENNIIFKDFKPEDGEDGDYYIIKPITLSADAGFLDMAAFIEKVTTLKRIMNVHSVSFDIDGNSRGRSESRVQMSNDRLAMTAQLRTYIFKEDLASEDGK